jgi:hypothetical protein
MANILKFVLPVLTSCLRSPFSARFGVHTPAR